MLVVPLPSATEVVLLKVVVVVVATVGIGRAVGAVDADEVGTALGSHGGGSGAAAAVTAAAAVPAAVAAAVVALVLLVGDY